MRRVLCEWLAAMVALASSTGGVAAADLSAGPGAVGDNTYAGAIDTPAANGHVTSAGAVHVSGWFVDRTAQGWAGVDDVEVFLGTMGNGGRLLAHAFFQQDRPDVAAALGNAYWSASGWSALIPTASLPP